MERIYSIAQLEEKLRLYRDGIISDTEMRTFCTQVGIPVPRDYRPPSEATRLRREAKRLRKELAKARHLDALRAAVLRLQDKLVKSMLLST